MGQQIAIAQIVWDEQLEHMEVAYSHGDSHRVVANQLVATVLAQDAGLTKVPAPPGLVQWIREPASA